MLQRLFRPRPARQIGASLFEAVTRQARQPAFYVDLGVPDTVEGRFELYSLHVILLLNRLRGQGGEAGEVGQALFDAYLRSLDDALRDLGVGDLSVGKKMRKLGEAFYGRAKSYDSALAGQGGDLEALVGRTIFAESELAAKTQGPVGAVAAYVRRCQESLAAQSTDTLLSGEAHWAEIVS